MTGAPVPAGADAVAMIEHCAVEGDRVTPQKPVVAGDFIDPWVPCAAPAILCFAVASAWITPPSRCWPPSEPPTCQYFKGPAWRSLHGDEIVGVRETPAPHQVRNSNCYSLAAQVSNAGGIPHVLPVAPDNLEATLRLVEKGLAFDLLLLSGGVSAGKYDVVEHALEALGAEFFFDRVLVQPANRWSSAAAVTSSSLDFPATHPRRWSASRSSRAPQCSDWPARKSRS